MRSGLTRLIVIGLLVAVAIWGLMAATGRLNAALSPSSAVAESVQETSDYSKFQQATEPGNIQFPDDFGPHPDYHSEWWYYTGNVETAEGRKFGYQLTFFRRGIIPPAEQNRESAWAVNDIFMAHFSLTDVADERFYSYERFQRGGALAGAQAVPYSAWLDDWSVEELADGIYKVSAAEDGIAVNLTLTDLKGPVLQGDQGLMVKNSDTGHASHYFAQTRLESYGTIQVGQARHTVTGFSWMDREWYTPLSNDSADDVAGWDWFALQLSDGRDLMYYQLRRSDGSIEPLSAITLIDPEGNKKILRTGEFEAVVLAEWTNRDGHRYPAQWRISAPADGLNLIVTPVLPDQEMRHSETYWEGAVTVSDATDPTLTGVGYVELTGYAGELRLVR